MGANALFSGRYPILFGYKHQCYAVCPTRCAEQRDGTLHLAYRLSVGSQTAVESVCGRPSHETMVGSDDADPDGRSRSALGLACAARLFHDCPHPLYHHRFLFRHARHSSRRLLHDRAQRDATVGLCRSALYVLPHREHLLPVALAHARRMVAETNGCVHFMDLCPTPLQRHLSPHRPLAHMGNALCRGKS